MSAAEPATYGNGDYLPLLLVPGLAAAALCLMAWQGVPVSSWITLTIAALAMGMMIFVIASGLTLVFGLMDVLNFGHGAFIAVGAYLAMSTLDTVGELDRKSLAGSQPAGTCAGHAGRNAGHRRARPGV